MYGMAKIKLMVFISGLAIAGGFPVSAQNAAVPPAENTVQKEPEAVKEAPAAATAPVVIEEKGVIVIKASPETAVPVNLMSAEWEFFKTRSEDKDEDVIALLLPQLSDFIAHYPDSGYAGEAQLLKANFHLRLGDYKSAILDLLKHSCEYPLSASSVQAGKLFNEITDKKIDKKLKPLLAGLAKGADSADKAEKLAGLLEKLSSQAGEMFYEPLVTGYREFFNRFPDYHENDGLRLALADLYSKKQEYLPAKLAYEKMIRLFPASPLLAKAKLSLGAVLADKLKEYDEAIAVYQDIAVSFPGTGEAWTAYGALPKLSERQKKYGLAVETYEKIISLYPDKEEAYGAFKSEARVLREEMEKPAEAVAVLNRLADKYKGEKAVEALFLAAEICRKDIKDPEAEIRMYDRIVSEYSTDPQAPKALFAAAEVYEKGKKLDNAREYYVKVIENYAENSLAKKAQKRLDAMSGK
jgi:TolA-binding protein